jgi:alkanesulfonate monooxygenase SsuD/methylene tetrahydromethanopterin reductase-like flavin-dependent oxidoreductase (luciferase family)
MIGGSGEKKTVKLMAQYADTCNFTVVGIDDVAHKLDVLRRHCDDAGRDFAQIRKTAMYAGPSLGNGELDAFATEIERYAALDIDTVIVSTPAVGAAQFIDDCVGPAVRRVAELG